MTVRIIVGSIRKLTLSERLENLRYKYIVTNEYTCIYNDKQIVVPIGFKSNGATGGPDIGWSWLFHDYLYLTHQFADGSTCDRQLADKIMYDILIYENLKLYAYSFKITTKLFPCLFERAWSRIR